MKYIYTVLLCLFLAVTNIQADVSPHTFFLVPRPGCFGPGARVTSTSPLRRVSQ